jgi:dTDP-4-dehydrorhamnose reductase
MPKPIFLITGANGQVGWELQRTLSTLGSILAIDREELDLAQPNQIRTFVRELRPDFIVNAAAYTAVDQAEREEELASLVNCTAPLVLAEEAKRSRAVLVSYSTDYVFDGLAREAYTEESIPDPLGAYGRTKLAGDEAVQTAGGAYLIFRTAWVYGNRGKNFYLTMLRLAAEGRSIRVVDDQIGAPTWSRAIAEVTAQVIASVNVDYRSSVFDHVSEKSGIYNLTSTGQTSWFGFAKAILQDKATEVVPITTGQYPTPVRRPAFSVLSTEKLSRTFGIHMPHWRESLALAMELRATIPGPDKEPVGSS